MRVATYHNSDGRERVVEYDETAPCWACGLPVVEASTGGTVLCPWCDSGYNRDGTRQTLAQTLAASERFREQRMLALQRATEDNMIVDHQLLARLQGNPEHRERFGGELLDAFAAVVRAADFQTAYPTAETARDQTMRNLRRLQLALQEALSAVPGVDVPR